MPNKKYINYSYYIPMRVFFFFPFCFSFCTRKYTYSQRLHGSVILPWFFYETWCVVKNCLFHFKYCKFGSNYDLLSWCKVATGTIEKNSMIWYSQTTSVFLSSCKIATKKCTRVCNTWSLINSKRLISALLSHMVGFPENIDIYLV